MIMPPRRDLSGLLSQLVLNSEPRSASASVPGNGGGGPRGIEAVAYYRVSTPRQVSEGLSLEDQQRRAREKASELSLNLVREYQDSGCSGRRLDRDEFLKMVAFVEDTPTIGHVISLNPSRLGRNNWLAEFLIEFTLQTGVELHFIDCDFDLGTAVGRRSFRLDCVEAAFVAEQASEDSSQRGESIRSGGQPTSVPPQGYDPVHRSPGRPYTYEVNEMAAKVRMSFELVARRDRGLREILDLMNEEGLRTRSGRPYSLQSFSNMLRNRTYTGRIKVSGDEWVGANFPAIIPDEMFEVVQARLERRTPGTYATRKASLALMGYARCLTCGGALTGYPMTKGGKIYRYYKCDRDSQHFHAPANNVDGHFARLLGQYRLDPSSIPGLRAILEEEARESHDRLRSRIRGIHERLSALPDELARLQDSVRRGQLNLGDFASMKARHEAELTSLEEALGRAKDDMTEFENWRDSRINPDIDFGTLWLEADLDTRRELQTACFPGGILVSKIDPDRIEVEPAPPGPDPLLMRRPS